MTDTANIGLTNLEAASSQKHISVNEGWRLLDALTQIGALDKDLTAPPAVPTDGDTYIVGPAATGLWAGQSNNIAYFAEGAWFFYVPKAGWSAVVVDESATYIFDGGAWIASPLGPQTTLTVNKALAAGDNPVKYTTGGSTRALVGTLGDDDYVIKVSPDGAAFTEAVRVDKDTGAVSHNEHPKFSGYCNYDQYNAADAWFKVDINNARHNDQSSLASGVFTAPHDGYYSFGAGVRHKINGTPPDALTIGLSVNGAAPTSDAMSITGNAGWTIDDNTSRDVTGHLKLTQGQTVELQCYFTGQDGYVTANFNYFWGHQVA